MPSTRDIRRRIKSVKSTAQITKAMQLVAAAKMKKAQDQATNGRPYADLMNKVLVSLYAMQKGYFDDVAVDRIKECQAKMEDFFITRKDPLLEQIGNEKSIEKCEEDIKSALADFKSSWK